MTTIHELAQAIPLRPNIESESRLRHKTHILARQVVAASESQPVSRRKGGHLALVWENAWLSLKGSQEDDMTVFTLRQRLEAIRNRPEKTGPPSGQLPSNETTTPNWLISKGRKEKYLPLWIRRNISP